MTSVLLVGNPNSGKSTVFNALTGTHQRVGNWPGVTVEKKTGYFYQDKQKIDVTDLPGIYSLLAHTGLSKDEQIAAQAIAEMDPDCIVNIIDACHLERHLYLTSQLLELGKPLIVALNMMDIAQQRGITIDIDCLEKELGCKVIPLQAHKNKGIHELKASLLSKAKATNPWKLALPPLAQQTMTHLQHQLIQQGVNKAKSHYHAYRIAEGDECTLTGIVLEKENHEELDIILADARYQKIHEVVCLVQKKQGDSSEHFTAKLDKIVLHRFFALPIFLLIMYLMFFFAINVGGAFQDFFDLSTDTIFVQGSAWLLQQLHAPTWLIAIIANGIGKGINTMMTFIPVISAMYFFLSFLEHSGYMARAAFVVDRLMRLMGLPGKSFVPMIVGFGCNVPAIMAARTLDSERDRILTVLMSPFMSCSARLAIYAVFVAAFFPHGGQNVVFSLYIMGILMAVLTGFILRKTTLTGHASPLILELPAYHRPRMKQLFHEMFIRLRIFIVRAGTVIIPICVLLGGLNAIILGDKQSLLSLFGQWLTPLFSPLGIMQDNWPATVGLLTGTLAKEVVVGTLNSLYAQMGHLGTSAIGDFDFWAGLQAAFYSIPQNISQLLAALGNPIAASAAPSALSQSVYGIMSQSFDGLAGAYAYLLFVLLYIPCVSTMAVIRQETNKQWMWISIIWSFAIAYASSVIFYQTAHFFSHPQTSIFWIVMMLLGLSSLIVLFWFRPFRRQYAAANS